MTWFTYIFIMFIFGITAFDFEGYVGLKILAIMVISIFIMIFYSKKWNYGFVVDNIFYCSTIIISTTVCIIILYLSPTIHYITQPQTMLSKSDRDFFIIFSVIVLFIDSALLYKFFKLKKQRQKLQQALSIKLAHYAILDFVGEKISFKNYIVNQCDIMAGNYFNDVFAIIEGEYTLSCSFLYIYTGTGRKGLCTSPIDNIKISMRFVTGKQYRIRLAEGEYIMDDEKLYQVNMTIPVTRNINNRQKVLSILVEEKL